MTVLVLGAARLVSILLFGALCGVLFLVYVLLKSLLWGSLMHIKVLPYLVSRYYQKNDYIVTEEILREFRKRQFVYEQCRNQNYSAFQYEQILDEQLLDTDLDSLVRIRSTLFLKSETNLLQRLAIDAYINRISDSSDQFQALFEGLPHLVLQFLNNQMTPGGWSSLLSRVSFFVSVLTVLRHSITVAISQFNTRLLVLFQFENTIEGMPAQVRKRARTNLHWLVRNRGITELSYSTLSSLRAQQKGFEELSSLKTLKIDLQ